jgi:branched-chain amino acid transport system substrate-binding protein
MTQYKTRYMLPRRALVATAATGAALGLLPRPFLNFALAQETGSVKIGQVLAKQGTWAEHGQASNNAVRIALEQSGGKVLGRPVEIIWYDEPNPQSAQQNAQRLIDEDKVAAFIGGSNSATGLAMSSVALRGKTPMIIHAGAAREITGKNCNRYTFRTLPTVPVFARAIASYGLEYGKKWYFLVPAYAFGTDMYAAMKEHLVAAGGTEAGYDQVPTGTTDYSSYVLKIRQAKPDAVVVVLVGTDLANFMKQYLELGMGGRVPIIHPVHSDPDIWPLGKNIAPGIYGKGWHFSDPANSDDDKKFVELYKARHKGPPPYNAYLAWISARMLFAAIDQAGSTKAGDIVQSLEKLKKSENRTPIYYRPWDHQMIRRLRCRRARTP